MSVSPILFKTIDNAAAQLSAGIAASDVNIPLQTSQGALFPQPYHGTASSLGSATTLNCTGIGSLSGIVIGKFIRNVTDGSWAYIQTVSTNSITTTALQNGSDNLWENADAWRVDEFVITLEKHDSSTPPNVTAREKVLIYDRTSDTLIVSSSSDRGYDASSAQTFDTDDYVYIEVTSVTIERLKDQMAEFARLIDTNITNIATNTANIAANVTAIGNLQTGSYHYVVATGSSNAYVVATPALGSYAAGNLIRFQADFANTGSATLNVNGLGAKTIKKLDGATNLASGDIANGQIVTVVYDGTNFQMVSPLGQTATARTLNTVADTFGDSSTLTNPTTETAFSNGSYTIPANDLINTVGYDFYFSGTGVRGTSGTVAFLLYFGSTLLAGSFAVPAAADTPFTWKVFGKIWGTAAAGSSVAVRSSTICMVGKSDNSIVMQTVAGDDSQVQATNASNVFALKVKFGTSNGSNTIILKNSDIRKFSTVPF